MGHQAREVAMTKALERAFREASKLPESEQDALAEAIRNEVLGEDEWERSFSGSSDALENLADEAIAEHRAGRTQPLKSGKR
jgi:hypothetical protein